MRGKNPEIFWQSRSRLDRMLHVNNRIDQEYMHVTDNYEQNEFALRNFTKNALHLSNKLKYQMNNFLENNLTFNIVITTLQLNTKYTDLKNFIRLSSRLIIILLAFL